MSAFSGLDPPVICSLAKMITGSSPSQAPAEEKQFSQTKGK